MRVTLADGGVEQAAYVVGCDGIRSFTRQAAGLPFPGAPNPGSVLLADLFLDGLPMTDAYGDLSDRGMAAGVPLPGRLVPAGSVRLRAGGHAGDRAGHP